MFDHLETIYHRPRPFEFYTAEELWTDEHTSALEPELNGCGFDVEESYADVAGSAYNPAHTEFAVVARKQ